MAARNPAVKRNLAMSHVYRIGRAARDMAIRAFLALTVFIVLMGADVQFKFSVTTLQQRLQDIAAKGVVQMVKSIF